MKKTMISFVSLGLICTTLILGCETNQYDEELSLNQQLEIPEKIISTQKAIKLFQNDHSSRLHTIDKHISHTEKAIHYELATFTNYLQHLETIAVQQRIPITGISFIFGADAHGNRTNFVMPSTHNAFLDYQESFTIEDGNFLTFKHIDKNLKAISSSTAEEKLILSPEGYLSFNEAVMQFNAYQTLYIEPFARKVPKTYYTKAVWYSLEEIKSYLKYLQKRSRAYNLQIDGFDVYFGVYDKNPALELKSNAQTVFLIASAKQTSIVNTKGDIFDELLTTDVFIKNDNTEDVESLAYNLGHLSPPPPKS